MATAKSVTIRGVKDIRTHAGRTNAAAPPYQAYFRIGALEMETARRAKERQSAMKRVDNIDDRVREIEAEKDMLLKKIAADRQRLLPERSNHKKDAPGNFKIRY